jgi:hypothetical protein
MAYGNKRASEPRKNPTQMSKGPVGTWLALDDSVIQDDVSGHPPRIFPAGFGGVDELVSNKFH